MKRYSQRLHKAKYNIFPVLIGLLISACMAENPNSRKPMLDTAEISAYIQNLSDSLHAEVIAVSFFDLETGQEFHHNEKHKLHAASTMKVPVMIELFRQAEAGKFSLDDSVTIQNEFRSIVDGSKFAISEDSEQSLYERIGQKASIRKLMSLMITWSSNLATNLLIGLVDAKNVTATMRTIGAANIQVLRGVEDIKAYRKGWNNRTDAYDMMVIMRAITENEAASEAACKEMIGILKQQHFTEGIASGLPEGVAAATKSGAITAIDHDCGIVFPPERKSYILIILTKGIADQKEAQKAIASISRKFYQNINPNFSN
ncbi:MAG: serine hydrolase [bacterium]